MIQPTLVARIAWVQTLVTLSALLLVMLLTWLGVSTLLTRKTDQTLRELLTRTVSYLDAGPPNESVDWNWLALEIEEIRPRNVRFEVRERSQSRPVIALGSGSTLEPFVRGCRDRAGTRICGSSGRRYVAMAASDRAEELAARNQLMVALTLACVLAAAAVALASAAVTRRAIHPLADLAQRIAALEPGSGKRLESGAALREIRFLEQRFAELIERFEQALLRERHFAAHASHELRTPLTVARGELEALAASPGAAGVAIGSALAALSRLQSLTEALLWFARAQAPLDADDLEVVNIADLLSQQVDRLRGAQPACCIECRLPDEALVRGDQRLLASATTNLLDNAIKHGQGTPIAVELTREAETLGLRVANGGPAVPQQLREQLFVPFVRGHQAAHGFGLGLAFARAVARAHGGDLTLGDCDASSGTTLLMRLPLLDWNDELGAG